MSYSSTNSKGYLQNRFHRLNGTFPDDGNASNSPITITDNEANDFILERYQQSDTRNNYAAFNQ
jgi:hypothetical protein